MTKETVRSKRFVYLREKVQGSFAFNVPISCTFKIKAKVSLPGTGEMAQLVKALTVQAGGPEF